MYHVRAFLKHLQENISPICDDVSILRFRYMLRSNPEHSGGVDLLTLLTQSLNVFWVLTDSIQRHMVTPASHPIGVGRSINHVKNKKYWTFVSISSLTGQCAAQKIKIFCSSSIWTCLHHMVILGSQNKITAFLMTLAWVWAFNYPFI